MRAIGDDERRARLARRHGLAPADRFADVTAATNAVVALHATDPASVFLAARARLVDPSIASIEAALYEQRTLVRMLGMRRTMFVVPTALAAVVQASSTRALLAGERKRFVALLQSSGVAADGARWLDETQAATLCALAARGEATAAELGKDVPALRAKTEVAIDKPYGAIQGVATRVLFLLAAEGRIVRGRPLGSLTSSLYRWAPVESWLAGPIAQLETDAAAAELVRRWLVAFGPGTLADMKWWTGWTMGPAQARARAARRRRVDARGRDDGSCSRATRSPSRRRTRRGSRCCRRSTPRRWVGRSAPGTSASTVRRASIAAATSADGLVGRQDRRRLGAAQGQRRGRRAPARGDRRRGRAGRR